MWCKQCRQDVPGVPSKNGRARCLRCGTFIGVDTVAVDDACNIDGVRMMAEHGLELGVGESQSTKPAFDFDDWDLDPDLRSFRNAQKSFRRVEATPAAEPTMHYHYDAAHPPGAWPPHGGPPPGTYPAAVPYPPVYPNDARVKRASWLAWMAMSLGFMAFACGGVLLGWSFLSGRQDLWNLGMPAAIGGQISLLVGLVLQLERIWQNNRYAVDKLDEVDERLADIKHSQSLMSVNHSSAAQAFYSHMAEGASPSLLLADLKGQLDLLAVKLSQRP